MTPRRISKVKIRKLENALSFTVALLSCTIFFMAYIISPDSDLLKRIFYIANRYSTNPKIKPILLMSEYYLWRRVLD